MGEFLRDSLFTGFADRYFPAAAPPPASTVDAATAKAHAAMIAGHYITTRRSDSTFLSLVNLIGGNVVVANKDGTITATPLGQPETFVEVSPFVWQQFNGHDRIQATASGGKVTRWGSDSPQRRSGSSCGPAAWRARAWSCRWRSPRWASWR